jgi:hypothetical protein
MYPNKLSNLNQNQVYNIDFDSQSIYTRSPPVGKSFLYLDVDGYAWEYMGTYQYETEFPTNKTSGYGPGAVNSSLWRGNPSTYIAICKDTGNTANGWTYTWNDEPRLQTKIADSTVGCNDNSAVLCGSGNASSKTWAVYKQVRVPIPNPTNTIATQTLRFEPLDPLNSVKVGQSVRCLNPTTNLSTFTQIPGSNYWDANGGYSYTCPTASGVRTDIPGWCVFSREDDVKKWCSSDINCVGYVADGSIYQALNKPAIRYPNRTTSTYFMNDTYRYKGSNTISKYMTPNAAYTWDPNYNSPMQLYCDTINMTKDTDLGHNYPIGAPLVCGTTAPPGSTPSAVSRYDSPNTIRIYPNATIAASWDPNWGNYSTVDCNGMNLGPNMSAR